MDTTRRLPQVIAQPIAVPIGGRPMAAVAVSPYGGADQDQSDDFPAYASLTPMTGEAPATSPWMVWGTEAGVVYLAFDKPGEPGAMHVMMESGKIPATWWALVAERAQAVVLWLPDARHPTTEEMLTALRMRSGWMASARRVPPIDLQ